MFDIIISKSAWCLHIVYIDIFITLGSSIPPGYSWTLPAKTVAPAISRATLWLILSASSSSGQLVCRLRSRPGSLSCGSASITIPMMGMYRAASRDFIAVSMYRRSRSWLYNRFRTTLMALWWMMGLLQVRKEFMI